MPIVKIVPMPGPQGPGGSGEGGDIADFVFDLVENEENTESRITVANHDMVIRTTRDDDQDADITLDSADDIFITANGDDVHIDAADDVEITTNINGDGDSYTWEFTNSGELSFPDGTIQTTAYVAPETEIIPLPDFLAYEEGRSHLPTLNTNFGWNSNGVYFGPTQGEGEDDSQGQSYPIFTDFTIPETTPVIVELEVVVAEDCADAGIAFYVDGTTPEWSWGSTNSTRIAAQFNCLNAELSGINSFTGLGENSPLTGPGTYLVIINYTPGEGVVFDYGTQLNQLGSLSLDESLPTGNYRIGFASDNDRDDEGDSSNNRTYIKNLTITLNPVTEGEVVYTDTLTNGNSGAPIFNTGDITFDGVKIIGAGTASGDGNGYGTMELVPDGDLNSDQYLIIDPTGPNHIHIRAGGEQDNSGAELILGAEKTNVKVSDYYGQVRISTSSENFTFNRFNEQTETSSIFSSSNAQDLYNAADGGWVAINPDGVVAELTGTDLNDQLTFLAYVAEENFFQPSTNYIFRNGNNFDGDRSWVFGADGVLEGPGEGAVKVFSVTNAPGNTLTVASNANVSINAVNEVIIASETDGIYLAASGGAYIGISSSTEDKIATLGDIGEDTSFTVAGGTLGNAPTFNGDPLFTGSYVKTGPMVHFRIDVDFDNISSFGTGQYYLDLPFPAKYNYEFTSGCLHDISETRDYPMTGHIYAGESRMLLKSLDASGNSAFAVPFTATAPVTLAVADNFHISGNYIVDTEAP
jgi:hypothetical protein